MNGMLRPANWWLSLIQDPGNCAIAMAFDLQDPGCLIALGDKPCLYSSCFGNCHAAAELLKGANMNCMA